MIAVDTNILVDAHHAESPHHAPAFHALRNLALGDAAWGLPVFVLTEFLRVVTHPHGPLRRPTAGADAMRAIDDLARSPSARVLYPGRRFVPLLRGLVHEGDVRGNLVFDAQVAAVCLEHGATTVLTRDKDFHRFPGIKVRSPDGG